MLALKWLFFFSLQFLPLHWSLRDTSVRWMALKVNESNNNFKALIYVKAGTLYIDAKYTCINLIY